MSHTPGEAPEGMSVRVQRMEWAATDVLELEFRHPDGKTLPEYEAGAHIDLILPNGITRSYSIKGAPEQTDRYIVGVGLDPLSRGGSKYVHQTMRAGDTINISHPRNNFPLVEDAAKTVLIAGGIGVTPMVCMARRLVGLGRECEFIYAVRSCDRAAFRSDLEAMNIALTMHVDEDAGRPLDIAGIVSAQPEGTHLYCCGPQGMMAAFEDAAQNQPEDNVHVEYFSPKVVEDTVETKGFTVVFEKSGQTVEVGEKESIAEAADRAGVSVSLSCEDGICGTCETRVLEGVPDHRDSVLTKREQEAGKSMMICVSRCKGSRLILDL